MPCLTVLAQGVNFWLLPSSVIKVMVGLSRETRYIKMLSETCLGYQISLQMSTSEQAELHSGFQ